MTHVPSNVLDFWFKEISPEMWWKKDHDFDLRVRANFLQVHQAAAACELAHWRETPEGRLAEIIVLDQFSRNIFRDTPAAFAFDPMALVLAQEAVRAGVHITFDSNRKMFLFMPYMHSESKQIHEAAVKLFGSDPALKGNLDFKLRHKKIIDRFGRYPHRNSILGRPSTPEETEFLKEPGSSF